MDPLVCLLPELHDRIFQHISVEDFKKATTVSPNWNEVVGKSRAMMKKVKLVLRKGLKKEESKDVIERISRCYQALDVDFVCLIHFSKHSHKFELDISPTVWKFVVDVSPTLSELEISNCCSNLSVENETFFSDIKLPFGWVLKLSDVAEKIVNALLRKSESVVYLNLSAVRRDGEFPQTSSFTKLASGFKSFLKQNQSLEDLTVADSDTLEAIFGEDISEIGSFELKHQRIDSELDAEKLSERLEQNLVKFLEKHALSLKKLEISVGKPHVIEQIFNKMSALTSLSFLENLQTSNVQLNKNENIVELDIQKVDDFIDFHRVIRVVPRLTKLLKPFPTQDEIKSIAKHLPELNKLTFLRKYYNKDELDFSPLGPHAILKLVSEANGNESVWTIERLSHLDI